MSTTINRKQRKQNMLEKISNSYEKFNSEFVVICEEKGNITHSDLKLLKKKVFGSLEVVCIKNTIFKLFLSQKKIANEYKPKSNNFAVFSKDGFNAMSSLNKAIKNLKLGNKIAIKELIMYNKVYTGNELKQLQKYNSLQDLYVKLCMTFKAPINKLARILYLGAQEKGNK